MAISGYSVWEVQQAGNDNNSGCFDHNATMTSTLSTTNGTNANPIVTASNYTFVSDDIGHYLYIKSGSGWYPGWYKILSVSSGAATVQATIGQGTSANGTITNIVGVGSSNSLSSGTWAVDYSQKPTAFKTYTDLYTYTNTGVNSAAQPFTPNLIGNVLNVTGGTGYFTGRFVINSVSGNNAALDRTIAASGTSGGQAILGGAMASVQMSVDSQRLYASASQWTKTFIKNDNEYLVSSTVSFGSHNYPFLIGYGSVRGDNVKARFKFTADNINWFAPTQVPTKLTAMNLRFDATGYSTATRAFSYVHFNGVKQYVYNCDFIRLTYPTNTYGVSWQWHRCLFDGLTTIANDSPHSLYDCVIQNCTNPSWWGGPTINCIFRNNGGTCINFNTGLQFNIIRGNTFYNNNRAIGHYNNCSSNQITNSIIENNLFVNNSEYAINGVNTGDCGEFPVAIILNNAFFQNTSGNINLGAKAYNDTSDFYSGNIILTASPFIDAANGDFRLNDNANGGKLLKGKAFPEQYFGIDSFTNAQDIGAVQSASNNLDKTLGTLNKPILIKAGTTGYTEFVYLSNTGYTFQTTGLKAFYIRPGINNTQITLASQTVNGSYVSGGFVEVDPINMPGLYRFDVPDVVLASGATTSVLQIINQSNNDKAIISYKFQDPINLNLTQSVPLNNTDQTVGDALNSARAYGFGKWAINGNLLEYYTPDNLTIMKSLTLDNSNYPRSRGTAFTTFGLVMNLDAKNISSYPGYGNTWFDTTGNLNHVTLTNGPVWNSNGYFVNDADSYFTGAGTSSIPIANSSYSMFVYARMATWADQRGFISIGGFGTNNQSNALRTQGSLGTLIHYWWWNDLSITNNNANIALNRWFYVGATFDGITRKVYVDGILVGSDTPSNHNVTSTAIQISRTSSNEYQQGDIATAQIYNRALTIEEVNANLLYFRNRFGL